MGITRVKGRPHWVVWKAAFTVEVARVKEAAKKLTLPMPNRGRCACFNANILHFYFVSVLCGCLFGYCFVSIFTIFLSYTIKQTNKTR